MHFNGQTIEVTAPTIEVADTIGAGDTVIGCLLAEIHRRTEGKNVRNKTMEFTGEDWAEIASYAARAAAVTCTRVAPTRPPGPKWNNCPSDSSLAPTGARRQKVGGMKSIGA